MWSTILCTDVVGIDYLFNSRNLNQLIFVEKGLLSRFLPTFAKTCTLYLKPFGMPIPLSSFIRMLCEARPGNMNKTNFLCVILHLFQKGTT